MHSPEANERVESIMSNGLEVVRRTTVEGDPDKALIVIGIPHGGDYEQFLEVHPEVVEQFKEDDAMEVVGDFMMLERDNGARKLGESSKRNIKELISGARLKIIEAVNIPRGLLDLNRFKAKSPEETDSSHGKIIDFASSKACIELWHELANIYDLYNNCLNESLAKLNPGDLFIDLHTMNDYSIIKASPLSANLEAIRQYIEDFTNPENRKLPIRLLEIITSFAQDWDEMGIKKGDSIENTEFFNHIKREFEENGIEYGVNAVYPLVPTRMTSRNMLKVRDMAISLDVTIRNLSVDGKSCSVNPELDMDKIEQLGMIIARAALNMVKDAVDPARRRASLQQEKIGKCA